MPRLNKRVLVFVDEHGSPGQPGFALGCVAVYGRDAGKADKVFSDRLRDTAKEIHAAELERDYVHEILAAFAGAQRRPATMVMLNRIAREVGDTPSVLYGRTLVETVSTAHGIFKKKACLGSVRKVHVMIDFHEQHSRSEDFWTVIGSARQNHGHFKGVSHVAMIDSAASRLLQLADLVAGAQSRADSTGMSPRSSETRYDILLR